MLRRNVRPLPSKSPWGLSWFAMCYPLPCAQLQDELLELLDLLVVQVLQLQLHLQDFPALQHGADWFAGGSFQLLRLRSELLRKQLLLNQGCEIGDLRDLVVDSVLYNLLIVFSIVVVSVFFSFSSSA